MRIVVTGGAGFVGKHLVDWLIEREHEVCVIDDLSTGKAEHVPPNAQFRHLDLTTLTAADLVAIFKDFTPDGVVHLAAMHFIPDCMARPERTFDVNTRSTNTLVEALSLHPVERFVIASTMDVYSTEDRPHAEHDAPAPANIYGLSKFLSEEILACGSRREVCRSAVAMRLSNIYGPNETNPHLIPDVFDRLAKPEGAELVMGYLGATRDFVFVKDVADAFGRAVTAAPPGLHRLNIGTGQPVAVREVVKALQGLLGDGRPMRENPQAFRKFDRPSLTPIVSAAADILGWRARRQIADGLAETVEALKHRAG